MNNKPMQIDDLIKWLCTEQEVFMFNKNTKQLLIDALEEYKDNREIEG